MFPRKKAFFNFSYLYPFFCPSCPKEEKEKEKTKAFSRISAASLVLVRPSCPRFLPLFFIFPSYLDHKRKIPRWSRQTTRRGKT